jgi:hypothetical protein
MLILLGLACYTPGVLAERYSVAQCERLFACDPGTASLVYWSEQDCRSLSRDQIKANNACMRDHCAFDPDSAEACVAEVTADRCEEFLFPEDDGPCAGVWTDCDGSEAACAE